MIDENTWNEKLKAIADESNRGCGCSYELYELQLSNAVKGLIGGLSVEDRAAVISLAIPLGYAEVPYLESPDRDDDDCCSHGMSPYNCPVGCGDRE